MDPNLLTPVLVGALIAFAIFRRLRRSFGRQPVRKGRLIPRLVIFLVIGALFLFFSAFDPKLLGAYGSGIAAGLVLGYFGLRHTTFETTEQGRFYTPHTYVGVLVTAVFLGRIAFRYLSVSMNPQAMQTVPGNPFVAYQRNPLSLAVFGILVGYYVYFNIGVLRKSSDPARATSIESPAS
jgi:hypothetical protein